MKKDSTVRVTRKFRFEMAHALFGYDGPCKNIHGHSYRFSVTISGVPRQDLGNSKLGMVIDFTDLKQIVNDTILKQYDHALVLYKEHAEKFFGKRDSFDDKIILVDFQPTCENMIVHFAKLLKESFKGNASLYSLQLNETENSYAEWYAQDNE